MIVKIYIFIFLLLSFGLIESKKGYSIPDLTDKILEVVELAPINEPIFPDSSSPCMDWPNVPDYMQQTDNAIVINEIMADPTPVVGLPDREYLELYNSGTTPVNLKNWVLALGSRQKTLPDFSIAAAGFLLLTAPGGARDLQLFGPVIEISGFLLNNAGLTLSLYDPGKRLADQIAYAPSLHKKGYEEGGHSLERIDPERLCGQINNWATSLSAKGGTPGTENSVKASNPDHTPPQILTSIFADQSRLEIQLSESVLLPDAQTDILRGIPAGVVADSIKIDQKTFLMRIWFRPESILNGVNYWLNLHGLTDECGNLMPDRIVKFGYYLPVKSDLLISEVLFNSYPEGSDFVEIYNNSGHEVDLSGLYLATRDEAKTLKQISQLSSFQQYMPAGGYLAVTKSQEGIRRFYRTGCEECLLQTEKFPTLADQSGCIVLLNQNREVIDEMEYNDGMHHPFISDKEGISLERISFTVPASRKENWHSAAKSAGFATPGTKNSAVEVADSGAEMIVIDPIIFSPNGDGINDQLNIYINTGEPGWILNITILNYAGRVIRKLVNNFTTGSSDQLVWDGLNGDYQKVQPGIYILKISLFERTGKHRSMIFNSVLTDHL